MKIVHAFLFHNKEVLEIYEEVELLNKFLLKIEEDKDNFLLLCSTIWFHHVHNIGKSRSHLLVTSTSIDQQI